MENESKKNFVLRLSPKMHAELTKWADEEFRSLNGQIEYILAEAIKKRTKKDFVETDKEEKRKP